MIAAYEWHGGTVSSVVVLQLVPGPQFDSELRLLLSVEFGSSAHVQRVSFQLSFSVFYK